MYFFIKKLTENYPQQIYRAMQKNTVIKGKIWLLTDTDGKLIDDIDTDMIFHNRYLAITDINEMGQYTFDNLDGWEDFAQKAESDDIVIAGHNFGAGSSRQQAVDCFISLEIKAILAFSFGAIYKRNAINSGLPILEILQIKLDKLRQRQELEINLETGEASSGFISLKPFSKVQMDIYKAGSLFVYGKSI